MLMPHSRRTVSTIIIDSASTVMNDRLHVDHVWCAGGVSQTQLLQAIRLAVHIPGRPLDQALVQYLHSTGQPPTSQPPLKQIAFDPKTGVSGNTWHHGSEVHLALVGMAEYILARSDLTENEREAATIQLHKLSRHGSLVVAVAKVEQRGQHNASTPPMKLIGFVSLQGSVAPTMRHLIQKAATAGVNVRLLSGGHLQTTYHVAKQIGLASRPGQVVDARQFLLTATSVQSRALGMISAFARATPEHKQQLITLLKTIDPSAIVVSSAIELEAALQK